MRLEPLQLWFQPQPGPLLPQLKPTLLTQAQAQAGPGAQLLRWAITAAEAERGLWVEAVLLVGHQGGQPAEQRLGQAVLAFNTQPHGLPACGVDGLQAPGMPAPGNGAIRQAAPGPASNQATTTSPET